MSNADESLFSPSERLRVAFVAGTLGRGGAEKQLHYMARALLGAGVDVRVYSFTGVGRYGVPLRGMRLPVTTLGRFAAPPARLAALACALFRFRPHVVQSAHTFANLYAACAGLGPGCLTIGALRSSLSHCRAANGLWTRWLVRAPMALVVNSESAAVELQRTKGFAPRHVHVLANVIDTDEFPDRACRIRPADGPPHVRVVLVGRLIRAKRVDRFLEALALARASEPLLEGVVVGDGPERVGLERAASLGLTPGSVTFLGERDDVPAILRDADMLVLTSDEEGFPNVLLEGMAARLPVITTLAGDAAAVVEEGVTGFVVPREVRPLACRMVELARSAALRDRFGVAGRLRAESRYGVAGLSERLLGIYRDLAEQEGVRRALAALS